MALARPCVTLAHFPRQTVKVQHLLHNSLPVQLTSFVGRESELAELAPLLGQPRLVTITGSAGMGKTRLAIEVASRAARLHPDGVCFAGLAPLTDPGQTARAVADALGVQERFGGTAVDRLVEQLG